MASINAQLAARRRSKLTSQQQGSVLVGGPSTAPAQGTLINAGGVPHALAPGSVSQPGHVASNTPPPLPVWAQDYLNNTATNDAATKTNTVAGLTDQENSALLSGGFTGQRDAQGNLIGLGDVDVNNPFSQAMLLKRNYDQSQRGITNSMAARGQLYAGSTQNAKDASTFSYQQGDDALRKQLLDLFKRTARARGQAGIDENSANAAAGAAVLGKLGGTG